jgi:hypothetical protein
MIECRRCAFYFKRVEGLDGHNVKTEGCVRELEPDTCHEFTEKWYNGNEDGFRDSLEEEKMSLDEYKDYAELRDSLRYKALKKMLHEELSGGEDEKK